MSTTARNRVTPLGEIVAAAGRGAWMGNRGVLHRGREIVRSSRNSAWIICALSFKDRSLPQWAPGCNTQLFFLDEAVALAAGHRPCAACRRSDFNAYRSAWTQSGTAPSAKGMDAQLAVERRGHHEGADWDTLPDGAFVLLDQQPAVVVGDHVTFWMTDNSYGRRVERPRSGLASVVTPPASVAVLRAGYSVQIEDTAR